MVVRDQVPSICSSFLWSKAIFIPFEGMTWKVHISLIHTMGHNLVTRLYLAVKEAKKWCFKSVHSKLAVYHYRRKEE
jgi:hypothetical protein